MPPSSADRSHAPRRPQPLLALAIIFALALVGPVGCEKPPATPAATPAPARDSVVGKIIKFNLNGESEQYRTAGWSKTEEEFTWSEGQSAKLSLPVGNAAKPMSLRARLAAYINPPSMPTQTVQVYANGTRIAEWQVGNTEEFTATIPVEVVGNKPELEIEIRTPNAVSPKAVGGEGDSRVLGVAMHELELTALQQ